MRHPLRRAIPLLAGAALALGAVTTAGAAFSDFTDASTHWARTTLSQAYEDGILKGYDAKTMAPNDSITTVQAVTVLCRVLGVTGQGDTSGFTIPNGAWYASEVGKGVYAGLLDADDSENLTAPLSRGEAFCLFARAFQVVPASPDLSVLDQFPDAAYLTGETQKAAAALVEAGVVNGSDGKLCLDRSLTRAEFATILYRLADQYTSSESYTGGDTVGAVLSGDGDLSDLTARSLWFGQSGSSVHLTDVTAQRVVIRSDELSDLSIEGDTSLSRLVLAAGSGDVDISLPETASLDTLQVGEGSGTVTVTSGPQSVEVTGDSRTVVVSTSLDSLTITGESCNVTIQKGCKIGQLTVTGKNAVVKLDGTADTLALSGRDSQVTGSGRASAVTLGTQYYKLTVSKGSVTKGSSFDIKNVKVTLSGPSTLAAGEVLAATANLTIPDSDQGKLCTASWYLNGELKSEEQVILGKDDIVSAITPTYDHSFQNKGTVKLVLSYENSDGDVSTKEAATTVLMDNFGDLGLADAAVTISAPETLAAGKTLTATAAVDTPESGQVCTGTWYVDGKEVSTVSQTLGGTPATLSYTYDYYYGMPTESTISYRLTYTTQDGREQEISAETTVNLENYADNGLAHASLTLSPPTSALEAGKELVVTAKINYLEAGKACTGYWYIDGKQVATGPVILGTTTPKLTYKYTYTENMSLTSQVKLVIKYTTQDGREQEISSSATITLKNYDKAYYLGLDSATVLKTVTSAYAGNYTLAWAQNHDYTSDMKTAWVNLKGYSSSTQYLVWVNLTYQRVNIFSGSQGNWTLVRTALCGSGKSTTPTPRGVYTTSYKQSYWNYGSYYCGPIVRFNGSSGYAFHSRLEYWPMNSDRYYDASIGYPVSHGCLRMYNDDIWWMYNNIPNGTTVVVY